MHWNFRNYVTVLCVTREIIQSAWKEAEIYNWISEAIFCLGLSNQIYADLQLKPIINKRLVWNVWIASNCFNNVGFEVFTAMSMKMAVFWVVAPCSLVELYQRFKGPCCLHHQGLMHILSLFINFKWAKRNLTFVLCLIPLYSITIPFLNRQKATYILLLTVFT
jgi:hypothetical protein